MLPDYAPRIRRRTIDAAIIQLSPPDIDESQQQALSS
jgi:hypothetical protein